MTAVQDFFGKIPEFQDGGMHNSEIILNRMEEIEGTSLNPIDKFIRWSRRKAIQRFPFLDLVADFGSLLILESIIKLFNTQIKGIVDGKEKITTYDMPVIFACNHETETEHLYLAEALTPLHDVPSPFGILKSLKLTKWAAKRDVPIFLAKYQLFNVPIIGSILMSTAFPIERELRDKKSFEIASQFIKRGNNIIIYPEGTRNLEKQQKAKTGVIRLAIQNKIPIVPVGHNGLHDITKGGFIPQKKGIWYCKIGDPIHYNEYYDKEITYDILRELTDNLMNKIEELKEYGRNYRERERMKKQKPLSEQTINEMVVDKFEALKKKPKNPIDSNYRKLVKSISKVPTVGEYFDSFANAVIRFGCDLVTGPPFFDIKITGKEFILNTRPAILCSNHESFIDILVQGMKLVPPDRLNYYGYLYKTENRPLDDKIWFMMKRELAEIPLLSSWTLSASGFPVGRGESDKQAFEIGKELVKRGRYVVVYPQQTTYKEIDIDTGKTGAIRMAIETETPIIPMSIKGSYHAMKKGIWKLLFPPKGYPIELNIGPPIYYDQYYGKTLPYETLKEETRKLMQVIKDLHDGKVKYPSQDTTIDQAFSPLDRVKQLISKPLGLPRKDLQEVETKSRVEKLVSKITDQMGITGVKKERKGPKKYYKLSPVDSFIARIRKRGAKLGLTQQIDKLFYNTAKDAFELILDNLYDFKVRGLENIPNDGCGVIFTTQSTSKLDFILINAIFQEKQVHVVVDTKTYQTPVAATLFDALGFLRQTAAREDFDAMLKIKETLKAGKYVAMFPDTKRPDVLLKTYAGVVKLAKEGEPTYIVPVGISGTETPFPPVKLRVVFGKPIGPIKRMNNKKRYELAEKIRDEV
ncbi:MAG: 1-acyl-sn-glycerol-3-phosphate acyltransferase, partial [Candidatus Helarchaeota archaeon]